MQCAGCAENRYCGKECQTADWPTHKVLCTPQKQNRYVLKMMGLVAAGLAKSTGVSDLYTRHPGYLLCLQYVGPATPDVDKLRREMVQAVVYAKFCLARSVLFVVGSAMPKPSSMVQGQLRKDSLALTHRNYIEIIAWVDKSGHSLAAGVYADSAAP